MTLARAHHVLAPVHAEVRARDKGGRVRRQEGDGRSHFRRCSNPTEGVRFLWPLQVGLVRGIIHAEPLVELGDDDGWGGLEAWGYSM